MMYITTISLLNIPNSATIEDHTASNGLFCGMPEKITDNGMRVMIHKFLNDEAGAITVDWVVLTAIVIGLGMIVLVPIAYSTDSSSGQVSNNIRDVPVGYSTP